MHRQTQVTVGRDALSYSAYELRFPPLERLKRIEPGDIELVFAGYPYEIALRSGDVALFPRYKEVALQEFVRLHDIRVIHGADPWYLLTEPYLDTEFTEAGQQRTLASLASLGFAPEEVESIRKRVRVGLLAYNMFAWEWCGMGLAEVLWSQKTFSEQHYRWAVSISRRGYAHAQPFDAFAPAPAERRLERLDEQFHSLTQRQDFRPKRRWWSREAKGDWHESFKERRAASTKIWEWLQQQYSEPGRHYHNLDHLEQVLRLLNSFAPELTSATLLAAWFHDAIYEPAAHDCEERSAEAMQAQVRRLNPDPRMTKRAKELVLYTKEHGDTAARDEQMLHDADMGIFGFDHETYAKYAAGVRAEYAAVRDDRLRAGRRAILEKLLSDAGRRGRFFYRLDPIFESRVEDNLRWELQSLVET